MQRYTFSTVIQQVKERILYFLIFKKIAPLLDGAEGRYRACVLCALRALQFLRDQRRLRAARFLEFTEGHAEVRKGI
jgi:hypothetical protein